MMLKKQACLCNNLKCISTKAVEPSPIFNESHLTPEDCGCSLQNLIVSLISWGMNLPRPLLSGAFSLTQPLRKNTERFDITRSENET